MIYKYTDFEEDERSSACIDREILGENVLAVLIQLKIRFNTVSYILFQVRGGLLKVIYAPIHVYCF